VDIVELLASSEHDFYLLMIV